MHAKLPTSVSPHFDAFQLIVVYSTAISCNTSQTPLFLLFNLIIFFLSALKLLTWHRRVGGLGGDGLSSISRYRCSDGDGGEVVDGVWGEERLLIMKIGSLIKGI